MKPRPKRCRHFSPVFQLLIVAIFLEDIAAQPIPYLNPGQHYGVDVRSHQPGFDVWPGHGHLPVSLGSSSHQVVVAEKPKTPQPIFFPYTVPIPWPTPFNGTHYAPTPEVSPATVPLTAPLSPDAYPLYIPYPHFQYVPLYYNDASPATTPKPRPRSSSKGASKSGRKPGQPKSPKGKRPKKPEQRTIDPICEDYPPSEDYVPPPKHTWVPPPENLPEFIPPPPSVLHTRSPASQRGKKTYTVYGPEPVNRNAPDSNLFYYHDPVPFTPYDPFASRTPYYDLYNPIRKDKTPVVSYSPDYATYVEPSRYGAKDDYFTFGPSVVTYIEDAPVATPFPVSRMSPVPPAFQPNRPRPYTWEYQPPSRPPPPTHPTSIGVRTSAPSDPDEDMYDYYEPETFTFVDDENSQFQYNPYPSSPPSPAPSTPVTIGGRSSVPVTPEKPVKDEDEGYVLFEPEYFDIVDGDNGEETIFYGPNVARLKEGEQPPVANAQPAKTTATQQS